MKSVQRKNSENQLNYDLSVSDLMSALVLIFILLLSTQLLELKRQSSIAIEFSKTRMELLEALKKEFPKSELESWGAEIDPKELSIRFKGEETIFLPESDILRDQFKKTLDDFFPRYIAVLMRPEFINEIDEIRIEGHTANPDNKFSEKKGYSDSIRLSQSRANNVLFYIMNRLYEEDEQKRNTIAIKESKRKINWVQKHISASGFAFAKPYPNEINPDWNSSRRVEFKIRTNTEKALQLIIEAAEGPAK